MRDITKLHPELQTKITKLKEECAKQGLKIGIGECVRTVAEQDALYAKGRTAPGNKVTNAKGSTYSSMHQWGVAFDFYRNDGKGAYYDKDNFFTKVGKIGQSLGLEWGGSWKSPVDKPHFQLKQWGSTPTKLKSLYKTPTIFMKTWKTTTNTKNTTVKKSNFVSGGIDYSLVFDPAYYTKNNKDLSAAGLKTNAQLFNHFLQYGMKEKRRAISTFDVNVYISNNEDLRKAFGTDWKQYYIHYINYGKKEGRKCK